MNLLLDTVTFLWILEGSQELTRGARAAIADVENPLFLSAVSAWEIQVKHGLGKLSLPAKPETLIPQQRELRGIASLPIHEAAALRLRQLPDLHADPFDRIIICQAIEHGMTIITPDRLIRDYPVRTLW